MFWAFSAFLLFVTVRFNVTFQLTNVISEQLCLFCLNVVMNTKCFRGLPFYQPSDCTPLRTHNRWSWLSGWRSDHAICCGSSAQRNRSRRIASWAGEPLVYMFVYMSLAGRNAAHRNNGIFFSGFRIHCGCACSHATGNYIINLALCNHLTL